MTLEGALDATVTDDSVQFAFTVTNAGSDPIDLQFSDASRADVAVTTDGEEVWRFTDGRMFAQVMGEETLDPDESTTYDVEWTDPESGAFTAVAELRARNVDCEARTEFSV